MRYYERLAEDDRMMRRTIADALEVLRALPDFTAQSSAHVRICPLALNPRDVVGMVDVEFAGASVGGGLSHFIADSGPLSRQAPQRGVARFRHLSAEWRRRRQWWDCQACRWHIAACRGGHPREPAK